MGATPSILTFGSPFAKLFVPPITVESYNSGIDCVTFVIASVTPSLGLILSVTIFFIKPSLYLALARPKSNVSSGLGLTFCVCEYLS